MNYRRYLRQYKDLLYPVLVVILLFTMVKYFFQPKISDILTWRDEIKSQEEEIQELSLYINYLKELADSTLEIEEEAVNYALPEDKGVVSLIVTYDGLSNIEEVELNPFTIKAGVITDEEEDRRARSSQKEIVPGEPRELSFDMKGTTEFMNSAKNFINEILSTRRIFEIEDLEWDFKDDGRVDMQYSLVAFYLPDPKPRSTVRQQKDNEEILKIVSRISQAKVYEEEVLEAVPLGKENLFSLSKDFRPAPSPTPTATESAILL